MTLRTNARVAGFAFLLYIALGVATMVLGAQIPGGTGAAERLTELASHESLVRLNMFLGFVTALIALTLGVALHAITRGEDRDIALLALLCRVGEGLSILVPMMATMGLLWFASGNSEMSGTPEAVAIAGLLFKLKAWNVTVAATFFAVGSTLFSWLMLRGRLIPVSLAWLGVLASLLLVVVLSLQMLTGSNGMAMVFWAPMGVFEIVLGVWLIVRGVREPEPT